MHLNLTLGHLLPLVWCHWQPCLQEAVLSQRAYLKCGPLPGVVVHSCKSSTWEAKAGSKEKQSRKKRGWSPAIATAARHSLAPALLCHRVCILSRKDPSRCLKTLKGKVHVGRHHWGDFGTWALNSKKSLGRWRRCAEGEMSLAQQLLWLQSNLGVLRQVSYHRGPAQNYSAQPPLWSTSPKSWDLRKMGWGDWTSS